MKELKINLNTFHMLSVIGKGSYAKVVLIKKRGQDNKLYAMKVLKKKYIQKRKQQGQVMIERNILTKIDHPFIVKMYHCFQDSSKLYFVLEFCPGGQLFNLLQKKNKFSEEQTKFFTAQIVLALEYLHNLDIVYRDLKPQNVLIDKYGYIRLTDFGLSNMSKCTKESKQICGTPQYIAPEMLKKQGHGKSIDWWCLGCLICQMLMGIPPFYCKSIKQLFKKIKQDDPTLPSTSKQLRNLLEGLFKKNPLQRLGTMKGSEQIKGHPWFESIDWQGLMNNTLKPPFIPVLGDDEDVTNFSPQFTECNINSETQELSPIKAEIKNAYEGFSYDNSPQSDVIDVQIKNNDFDLSLQIQEKQTN